MKTKQTDIISPSKEKLIRLLADNDKYQRIKRVIIAIKAHPKLLKYNVAHDKTVSLLDEISVGIGTGFTLSFLDDEIRKLEG